MNDETSYRPLTDAEIELLRRRGCRTVEADWSGVRVAEGFDAARLTNVVFEGPTRLGRLDDATADGNGGPTHRAEITNAHLVNCTLGDHVRILNVGVRLANYVIGAGACIENVGLVEARPQARFGNGVEVSVLNEAGGREVVLFDELSAQFAYLQCLCRHRPELVRRLAQMAGDAARRAHTGRGEVAASAQIRNVPELVDVRVGKAAVICGATRLVNGSVLSRPDAVTRIGAGVQAEDFIVAEGAEVTSNAMVTASYVGQAARVGRQFSAENCLFFANCEALHGEACSALAGPYTVTHHKSSLLIAAMFSFYNAGSGTNQSNHLYKLGPVHEGKLERGSKTGSFSYMMWPCRVGPFSVVLGKHARSFDTSEFPFSLIEALPNGRTALIPGLNLTTVGVVRDGAKWPQRDRRSTSARRDRISFDVFSPLTVGRMICGLRRLQDLQRATDRSVDVVTVNGAEIKRVFLRSSQKYYRRGVHMYLAEKVVARIAGKLAAGAESIADSLAVAPDAMFSETWVDVGGQMMPAGRLAALCDAIEEGAIADVAAVHAALASIEHCYEEDEWSWVCRHYEQVFDVPLDRASAAQLAETADTLLAVRTEFLNLVLADAEKEFDSLSQIGYGPAETPEAAAVEFQAVRGEFESNSFVREMRAEISSLAERVEEFKRRIAEHA